ncbi:hypothetical protein DK26_07995 [Bosea sp. WAO]|nr:hypothetical protein DK26_07995 [Bosea sp. WAO]
MVDGDDRAAFRISFATLDELEEHPAETSEEHLARFNLHRSDILTAARRLAAAGAHSGGQTVQIMRENLV